MRIPWVRTVSLVVAAIAAGCGDQVDNAPHAAAIRELTSGTPAWVDRSPLGRRLWKVEQAFYQSLEDLPAGSMAWKPRRSRRI